MMHHPSQHLELTGTFPVITITFQPGSYDVPVAFNSTDGIVIGNCTLRHVASVPGTVTLNAQQPHIEEQILPIYGLSEDATGVNTTVEFSGMRFAFRANTMFAIRLDGVNPLMNITDCTFVGGGTATRIAFHVGTDSKDAPRAATLVVTRTLFTEIQQDLTGYGLTRVVVTGGGSHRCYRWYSALVRAESGNLTVEDWEVTGAADSAGPVIQHLNTYTDGINGPKITAFWVTGATITNVSVKGK
ncbi:hypothetical protein HDU87_008141 [Geranomyces variabilis]|uniref:Uncharacterized protein n=1 Tax=Geranomyces variabilis TaxID=109894 RepID=A0AAD5XK11_9FUNG|nr:hypothetical protein HDU87_008141 [Geranomyces variabilis]